MHLKHQRHFHLGILLVTSLLATNFLVGEINKTYIPSFTTPTAEAQSAYPLIRSYNLNYLGAFFPPSDSSHGGNYDGSGTALTYKASTNTLLMVGSTGFNVGEFTIPPLVTGTNFTNLNTASWVQYLTDVTKGESAKVDGTPNLGHAILGMLIDGNDLYVATNQVYDSLQSQHLSHYKTGINFSNLPSNVLGPYQVGDAGLPTNPFFPSGGSPAGFTGGPLINIPAAYRTELGGDTLTGMGAWRSIISRTSWGPSTWAFNRGDIGDFNASGNLTSGRYQNYGPFAPATPLLGYNGSHPTFGIYTPSDCSNGFPCVSLNRGNDNFGAGYSAAGAIWVDGTDSLLFLANNGTPGTACYGPGTSDAVNSWPNQSCRAWTVNGVTTPGPSCNVAPPGGIPTAFEWCHDIYNYEGSHSYPNQIIIQAYDVNDLKLVKAGTLKPWDPIPYSTWQLTMPFENQGVSGITYDPNNKIIYITLKNVPVAPCCYHPPAILAYRVDTNAPPVAPPPAPVTPYPVTPTPITPTPVTPTPVTPAPVTPTPTPGASEQVVATDNFNRADSSNLGSHWTEQTSGLRVTNNTARGLNASFYNYNYWNSNSFTGNQYSSYTIVSNIAGQFGPTVRMSGTGGSTTGYVILARQDQNNLYLYKVVNGVYTDIGGGRHNITVTPGDVFKISANGTTINAYQNGTLVASGTDNSIASGSAGIMCGSTGADCSIDNWEGGNLVSSPTPAPNPSPTPIAGDLDSNGIVNSLDWSIMSAVWFTSNAAADLNHDGIVNSIDFSILNRNWFRSS